MEPFEESALQPSSIDLRLGNEFRLFHNHSASAIDVRTNQERLSEKVVIEQEEKFILHPKEFVLAVTRERVQLPPELVARLEGKSSLGRLGLLVHSTAGFIDAGFRGRLTLELFNVTRLPIILWPGMPIAQVSFIEMSTAAEHPYGSKALRSKYQNQTEPTPSRFYTEF